jgi:uncharacterized protein YbgA (DUF1722 family)
MKQILSGKGRREEQQQPESVRRSAAPLFPAVVQIRAYMIRHIRDTGLVQRVSCERVKAASREKKSFDVL